MFEKAKEVINHYADAIRDKPEANDMPTVMAMIGLFCETVRIFVPEAKEMKDIEITVKYRAELERALMADPKNQEGKK